MLPTGATLRKQGRSLLAFLGRAPAAVGSSRRHERSLLPAEA